MKFDVTLLSAMALLAGISVSASPLGQRGSIQARADRVTNQPSQNVQHPPLKKKPASKQQSTNQPSSNQPSSNQPSSNQQSSNRPSLNQPSSNQPTSRRPGRQGTNQPGGGPEKQPNSDPSQSPPKTPPPLQDYEINEVLKNWMEIPHVINMLGSVEHTKGGWEVWAQVEIEYLLKDKYITEFGGKDIREQTEPFNPADDPKSTKRADFFLPATSSHNCMIIELKTENRGGQKEGSVKSGVSKDLAKHNIVKAQYQHCTFMALVLAYTTQAEKKLKELKLEPQGAQLELKSKNIMKAYMISFAGASEDITNYFNLDEYLDREAPGAPIKGKTQPQQNQGTPSKRPNQPPSRPGSSSSEPGSETGPVPFPLGNLSKSKKPAGPGQDPSGLGPAFDGLTIKPPTKGPGSTGQGRRGQGSAT